jgi:hypothetical protein
MRPQRVISVAATALIMAAAAPAFRSAEAQVIRLQANLSGFEEVTPKLTNATGEFTAIADASRTVVTFTLTYADMSTPVRFSHIHFGQQGVNGGIMVFFCNNTAAGPQPRPCPAQSGGTIEGTFTASDVVGPGSAVPATDQGIDPGNLSHVISAILSGETYVNVHTDRWPGGELRGQVKANSATR